jgi:hypothetical protein
VVELLPRGDEGDVLQVAARELLDALRVGPVAKP